MAIVNGQRVGAFILALLFLLTTVGTAFYLIYAINDEDPAPAIQASDLAEIGEQSAQQNQTTQQPEEAQLGTLDNFSGPVEIPELRFEDEVVGDGEEVQPGATVTIHYTGGLATDGSVFDSSIPRGEPSEFPLENLIPGWQQGIPGMKVGGKRRLYIPAELAYGAQERSGIPANSDLIFDIELFATE